jgi:glucokinase
MHENTIVGADIGGSHITAALVDLDRRIMLQDSLIRRKVNSHGTVAEIIEAWGAAFEEVLPQAGRRKIGIAMPNPVDYEQGISYIKGIDKYDSLYGLNIRKLLAQRLDMPETNIRMKNDAGCFMQGEVFGGAAQGYTSAIGLTLGTGVGTARSHNGAAEDADLWHMPFRDSIVEEYVATRWFLRRYQELCGQPVKDVKTLSERHATDAVAQEVFREFADNLTELLVYFVRKDNPQIIVIGGNIANAEALFLPRVKENLKGHGIDLPIKRAVLGEEAAIVGAASIWSAESTKSIL